MYYNGYHTDFASAMLCISMVFAIEKCYHTWTDGFQIFPSAFSMLFCYSLWLQIMLHLGNISAVLAHIVNYKLHIKSLIILTMLHLWKHHMIAGHSCSYLALLCCVLGDNC